MSEKSQNPGHSLVCPICLDTISESDDSYTITSPCKHFYHYDCIEAWLKQSASTCPQCRTEVTSLNISNQSKIIPVKHKEADKLIGMIEHSNNNPNSTTNRLFSNGNLRNRPTQRTLPTDGLINVLVSTPENHTRPIRSLYERMVEATSSSLFHEEEEDYHGYEEEETDGNYHTELVGGRRNTGSLFIRRNNRESPLHFGDSTQSHLSNQQCCICDSKVLISQIVICPNCSALYHRSCCDGLNCPLCEEWIDDVKSPAIATLAKSRKRRNNTSITRSNTRISNNNKNEDSSYYVELVDEMQRRRNPISSSINNGNGTNRTTGTNNDLKNNNGRESTTELEAWKALNMIQQSSNEGKTEEDIKTPPTPQILKQSPQATERKLKRPKCTGTKKTSRPTPGLLTESALAHLDSKNGLHSSKIGKRHQHEYSKHNHLHHLHSRRHNCSKTCSSSVQKGLSFTQKLVIQRLLLKPRLNKDLSTKLTFDSYTELNKTLSHKLYSFVEANQFAISSMNAVIELAEREGFLPFSDRKSVDKFNIACENDTVLTKFVDCQWQNSGDSAFFKNQIQEIIDVEIRKWIV